MNRITIEKTNHVAIVRFNRPEKMNALDKAQMHAIIEMGQQLEADRSIRAVVLSGNGRAFCAGIDINDQFSIDENTEMEKMEPRTYGIMNLWQKVVWMWRELPIPVISAVHGYVFGAGLQMMMATDIRIVAPDAKMAIMETKWGLIPDMAGTQLFRHSVREDVVKLLTYTHQVFSGTEGKAYGFATENSDTPFDRAMEIATQIAKVNPDAIVRAKRLLNDAPYQTVADGFMAESIAQDQLILSKNQIEAVMAGMQKRDGIFEERG